MKATIIPSDGFVSIGGRGFHGIDMATIDPQIHAVQWDGQAGEMELVPDGNGRGSNIIISNLDLFLNVIDQWNALANAEDAPPTLQQLAADAVTALSVMCHSHIINGVDSDALGTVHTYPTGISESHPDQQNLNGCITESILNGADNNWAVPFWCADTAGVWDRRQHSHGQIRKVGLDVALHVRTAQDKLKGLVDSVTAIVADSGMTDAEQRAAINAITW